MLNVIGPLIILRENPFPSPRMPSVAIRLINVCLQNYIIIDFKFKLSNRQYENTVIVVLKEETEDVVVYLKFNILPSTFLVAICILRRTTSNG